MELIKDSGDNAARRDLRNLEATMLAGFEICFECLGIILANQKAGAITDPDELDGIIKRQRDNFQKLIDEKRMEIFHNAD